MRLAGVWGRPMNGGVHDWYLCNFQCRKLVFVGRNSVGEIGEERRGGSLLGVQSVTAVDTAVGSMKQELTKRRESMVTDSL